MPIGTGAAILGASLIGGGASIFGASKAASAQKEAAANALSLQREMFERTQAQLSPFINTGKSAMFSLAQLYGLPGENGQVAGPAFNENALTAFRNSPDYAFRFSEGMRALDNSNAAKGLLGSRQHLANTVQFGQGMAGTGFNDYASRLLALANIGSTTASNAATIGTGQGNALASTMMGAGQAEASGWVGATNAFSGALQGGVNSLALYRALQGSRSAYPTSAPAPAAPTAFSGSAPVPGVGGWAYGPPEIGAFADGGAPPVGRPSLVGERGPELFVPTEPGIIIPNEFIAGDDGPNNALANWLHAQAAAEAAAIRLRKSVMPAGGRQESGLTLAPEALAATPMVLRHMISNTYGRAFDRAGAQ